MHPTSAQLRWSIGPEDRYTLWKQQTANAVQEVLLAPLQPKSTQEYASKSFMAKEEKRCLKFENKETTKITFYEET